MIGIVPIDIIDVVLSYRKPTLFKKKNTKFKQGNVDWQLNLTTSKDEQFSFGDEFKLALVNNKTLEKYEITPDFYTYENDVITIDGAEEFVANAGSYSIIIEIDCNVSYEATYLVEAGFTCDEINPLAKITYPYVKNISEDPEDSNYLIATDHEESILARWFALDVIKTSDISVYANASDTGYTLDDILIGLYENMVTPDQLTLKNLTDNQIPSDESKAYSPFWNSSSGVMNYHALTQRGLSETNEARIVGSGSQNINFESGFHEIEFDSLATESEGTDYEKVNNGIKINNIENNFDMYAVVSVSFKEAWLQYPITLQYRFMKNGLQVSDILEIQVESRESVISNRILATDVINMFDLAVGDIITIEASAFDSSGFVGDGSWAQFTMLKNRNFSIYYRSLSNGGYYYNVEDQFRKYFQINKSDSETIPTSVLTPIAFTPSTIETNTNDITFSVADESIVFTTLTLSAYDILVTLNIAKTGSTGQAGQLKVLAVIEKWNEDSLQFEQYTTLNIGRVMTMAQDGIASRDFTGNLQFDEAGLYRFRLLWQDVGAGNLSNYNSFQENVVISTGETITESIETTIAILESAIH